jgi:hypothetical protein
MSALIAIFIGAALATWVVGVRLAKTTDELDDYFGLGEALGGPGAGRVGRHNCRSVLQ